MSKVTGTIESLKRDRTGFKVDGQWYTNYPAKPLPEWAHERGVGVEFEYAEKGGYKNIVEGTLKQTSAAPAGGQASGGGGNSYNRGWHSYQDKEFQTGINNRITRQNALGNAVAIVAAVLGDSNQNQEAFTIQDALEQVFTTADEMVAWVTERGALSANKATTEGEQGEATF